MNTGMMSSLSSEWATPQAFYDRLNVEFHFTLDVCATHQNAKCDHYYTKQENGLAQKWEGVVWCNPPYGIEAPKWCKKCVEYAELGGVAVLLVPARTDTRWWNNYCMTATEIRLISGRLHFGDSKNSAPFPSAVCIFGTSKYPRFSVMGALQ